MSSSYLIDAVEDVLEAGIIKCMFQFPWLSGGIKVLNQVYNLGGAPPPPHLLKTVHAVLTPTKPDSVLYLIKLKVQTTYW